MRITNSMMTNNTLANISVNKYNTDKLNTQMATEKKIQKPSDDPIIAVRALRFRSQLSELNQYLDRNIPDAEAWMKTTEDALDSMNQMITSMYDTLNQGANDSLTSQDREKLVDVLSQYQQQIYQDANTDYAGRRVFSGYKVDTDMIFSTTDSTVQYKITENLDVSRFEDITKVVGGLDITSAMTPAEIKALNIPDVSNVSAHRIRLSYDSLQSDGTIKFTKTGSDGTVTDVAVKTVYQNGAGDYVYKDTSGAEQKVNPYQPGTNDIYFLSGSGEMIFGEQAYADTKVGMKDSSFSITYEKKGFEKGELRPEHYFDCVRTTTDGTVTVTKFTKEQQDINYMINFNQSLKVNTEGKDAFTHDILRDMDELMNVTNYCTDIQNKLDQVSKMKESSDFINDTVAMKKLEEVEKALKEELDRAEDIMQNQFESSIKKFKGHQDYLSAEVADIGSRTKRLQLNEERLSNQKITLEDLKSSNEDVDLAETIIKLTAAKTVYEASLSAAGKIITTSLLDYL